jgi:hypothetical protein
VTKEDETKRVVMGYFDAWTSKKPAEAYEFLADNLDFSGPGATFHSRAEFRPGLDAFAAMASGARVVEFMVVGDRAAMLYDCDLPQPVGTIRIASFFRVENGKVRSYDTRFDATNFSKLGPPKK